MPTPFDASNEALRNRSWEPTNGRSLINYHDGLAEHGEAFAAGLSSDADKIANGPVAFAPEAHEGLREMGATIERHVNAVVADQNTRFKRVHHADINRLDNPRRGEEGWDVTRNQD